MCYISQDEPHLLLWLDIIPNVLFTIISILCIRHASKQLRVELPVLLEGGCEDDDMIGLIRRLAAFLMIAFLSSAFFVIEEIVWLSFESKWETSTEKWIECAQNETANEIANGESSSWNYQIGDDCIEQLKEEGYPFPHVFFFISFPVMALLRYLKGGTFELN